MKNNRLLSTVKVGISPLMLAGMLAAAPLSPVFAAEAWQAAFEDICSKVDASGSLSTKELSALIERADKLVPEIQASNDPAKKVYLRRLKNCRSMYEFMIETNKKSEK